MTDDPIAFFLTWTCYGTWLPGDERGWTKWHQGDQLAQPLLEAWCRDKMSETAIVLGSEQRAAVEVVVKDHCKRRSWPLHAVSCRTNHCHVVVSARGYSGEQVRDQLKSWCKRRLKQLQLQRSGVSAKLRERWWTRNGSVRYLFDEDSLVAAVGYTLDAQEHGGSKQNYLE